MKNLSLVLLAFCSFSTFALASDEPKPVSESFSINGFSRAVLDDKKYDLYLNVTKPVILPPGEVFVKVGACTFFSTHASMDPLTFSGRFGLALFNPNDSFGVATDVWLSVKQNDKNFDEVHCTLPFGSGDKAKIGDLYSAGASSFQIERLKRK